MKKWNNLPKKMKASFILICLSILINVFVFLGKLNSVDPAEFEAHSRNSLVFFGIILAFLVLVLSYNSLKGKRWARNILSIFGIFMFLMFLKLNLGISIDRALVPLNLFTSVGQTLFLSGVLLMYASESRVFFAKPR